jgi:hypothetical protein
MDNNVEAHHGLRVDYENLILAVAQAEEHILVRVIKSERTPGGPRPVIYRGEVYDVEEAKVEAQREASRILGHDIPEGGVKWEEYEDSGLIAGSL